MDPNLPLFRVLIRLAHGIGLPVDAVKKIRNEFLSWWWQVTLNGTGRLEDGYGLANYRGVYRQWAGTQRMVNRRRLITNYVGPSTRSLAFPGDVTDLGFITFDAPRNVQNPLGFRVQGQGMMNVFPKFRSPF